MGRLSICAEAVALGRALLEGDGTIDTVVAMRRHPKPDEANRELAIVPPCGACREMFLDHCADALVIMHGAAGLTKLPVRGAVAGAVWALARFRRHGLQGSALKPAGACPRDPHQRRSL